MTAVVSSKYLKKNDLITVGDEITFLIDDGLKTQEGTEILPAGR